MFYILNVLILINKLVFLYNIYIFLYNIRHRNLEISRLTKVSESIDR
jgi:hypothetical protein